MVLLSVLPIAPVAGASQAVDAPTIDAVRVGFDNVYKLGCWTPIVVELTGGSQSVAGQVSVTVPDTDGVPTTVFSFEDRPVDVEPGKTTLVRLLVRIGQANSIITARFLVQGQTITEQKFYSGSEEEPGVILGGVPATNQLLLELGPSLGLGSLLQNDNNSNEQIATRVIHLEDVETMPTSWIGYEGIDTVLLTTSQPEFYRPFIENSECLNALRRWVELGGRLIVFCGAEAGELLGNQGPLTSLIPGTFDSVVPLRQWQPLENFSGSERPKAGGGRLDLRVPKLVNVRGRVLVHAGRHANALPLVVQSHLGLGELVFVALDFDQPPLRDWKGRSSFLRELFQWPSSSEDLQPSDRGLASVDSEDMTGKLRVALDNQFVGVKAIPFALVAFFVFLYIMLIGPGDYFLVRKFLKRPGLTWITFPLIVLGVSAAAYGYANWKKGDQLRVNQVEVVDIDTATGLVRGTVWSHFFTPRVGQYDLSLEPRLLAGRALDNPTQRVSWLGLPGYSLGGMQAQATQTAVFSRGYTFSSDLAEMKQLPVQVWSTKTISARWSAHVEQVIKATLHRTGDELLGGQLVNSTGVRLDDCLLLYGKWAYRLGPIAEGATVTMDHSIQPRTVRTSLTNATAGDTTETNTADDGTVEFRLAEADTTRLMKVMMFFEAINGRRYTGKFNRYQSFLDMSHLLKQENLAILLAKCTTPGSQWLDGDQPFRSDKDRNWTFYRFVIPVSTEAKDQP